MKNTTKIIGIGFLSLVVLGTSHFLLFEYGNETGVRTGIKIGKTQTEELRKEVLAEVKASLSEEYANQTAQEVVVPVPTISNPEFNQDFTFSVMIDNTNDGFVFEGPWISGTDYRQVGNNCMVTRDVPGKATWKTVVPKGTYRVYANWVPNPTRNTRAPYSINGHVVKVNQRQGQGWYLLGVFDLDGLTTIELEGTRVCADAIGITNYPVRTQ